MERQGSVLAFALLASIFFLFAIATIHADTSCTLPSSSYLNIEYSEISNKQGQLDAYLYYIDRTQEPAPTGIEGGLLILMSGPYVKGDSDFSYTTDKNAVCKLITNAQGKASTKLPVPQTKTECISHNVVYCPFTNDYVPSDNKKSVQTPAEKLKTQQYLAQCAGLYGTDNKAISSVSWNDIQTCPEATSDSDPAIVPIKVEEKIVGYTDLRDTYSPSQNQIKVCGKGEDPAKVGMCWMAALIMGLLFAASFMSGKNPFMGFDFGATRGFGSRAGGSGSGGPPMSQQSFTPNVSGIARIVDRVANAAANKGDASQGLVEKKLYGDQKSEDPDKKKGLVGQMSDKAVNKLDLKTASVGADGKPRGSVQVDKAINTAIQGVVVGGATGMVNMAIAAAMGHRAVGAKGLNAGASAAMPYVLKGAGAAAVAGISQGVKSSAKNADMKDAHLDEHGRPIVNMKDFADTLAKEISDKSGVKCTAKEHGDGAYTIVESKSGKDVGGIVVAKNGEVVGNYVLPGTTTSYDARFEVDKSGRVSVNASIIWREASAGSANLADQSFNMAQFMQTKQMSMMGGGGATQSLTSWLNSLATSIWRGEVLNALRILTFADMGPGALSWIPFGALFRTFRISKGYSVENPRKTITLKSEDGKDELQKLQLINGKIWTLEEKKDANGNVSYEKRKKEVGTYDTLEIDGSSKFVLTIKDKIPGINASKDNPRVYAFSSADPLAFGPLVDITDQVKGKDMTHVSLDLLTKAGSKLIYFNDKYDEQYAADKKEAEIKTTRLASGNYELALMDGRKFIMEESGKLFEVGADGKKTKEVQNGKIEITRYYAYSPADYARIVDKNPKEFAPGGNYQINAKDGVYTVVPGDAKRGTKVIKGEYKPTRYDYQLFVKDDEKIIVSEKRERTISLELVSNLGLEKPKDAKIEIGGVEWNVKGRDDNGNWMMMPLTEEVKNNNASARLNLDGTVVITEEKKGKREVVEGLNVNGTTYLTPNLLPDEKLTLNNWQGKTNIALEEGKWEADFYGRDGKVMTYTDYAIKEKIDERGNKIMENGKAVTELVQVQKPVRNYSDFLEATLFKDLDQAVENIIYKGYMQGAFQPLEKSLGLKGFGTVSEKTSNWGDIIVDGTWNYLSGGVTQFELGRGIQRESERVWQKRIAQLGEQAQDAYERSGFEKVQEKKSDEYKELVLGTAQDKKQRELLQEALENPHELNRIRDELLGGVANYDGTYENMSGRSFKYKDDDGNYQRMRVDNSAAMANAIENYLALNANPNRMKEEFGASLLEEINKNRKPENKFASFDDVLNFAQSGTPMNAKTKEKIEQYYSFVEYQQVQSTYGALRGVMGRDENIREMEVLTLADDPSVRDLAKAQYNLIAQTAAYANEIADNASKIQKELKKDNVDVGTIATLKAEIETKTKEMDIAQAKLEMYGYANGAVAKVISVGGLYNTDTREEATAAIKDVALSCEKIGIYDQGIQIFTSIRKSLEVMPTMPTDMGAHLLNTQISGEDAAEKAKNIAQKITTEVGVGFATKTVVENKTITEVGTQLLFSKENIDEIEKNISQGKKEFVVKAKGSNEYKVFVRGNSLSVYGPDKPLEVRQEDYVKAIVLGDTIGLKKTRDELKKAAGVP